MLEHSDDCIWRTKNDVNHSGVENFVDCECDCHMGTWWFNWVVVTVKESVRNWKM